MLLNYNSIHLFPRTKKYVEKDEWNCNLKAFVFFKVANAKRYLKTKYIWYWGNCENVLTRPWIFLHQSPTSF